jgi:nucleotide-binding universal stress UspA family protein
VALAAHLSEELDCEIALVHVDGEERMFTSIARARQLRDLREVVNVYDLPSTTRVRIREGDPATELMEAVRDFDAELLVVGSRGRLELGSALLGSVSRTLMTSAPCPVVVVPPDALLPKRLTTRSIVCGVEGGGRDRAILRFAADLRRRLRSILHAVHGFDPRPGPVGPVPVMPPVIPELSEMAQARLAAALAAAQVNVEQRTVLALPPAVAIERIAGEDSASLVVVGCQGKGPLASVLNGSVSMQLAAAGRCPVVVLPPSAELAPGTGHYELMAGAA